MSWKNKLISDTVEIKQAYGGSKGFRGNTHCIKLYVNNIKSDTPIPTMTRHTLTPRVEKVNVQTYLNIHTR